MRRIIAMLLCVILCVNMIVVASARGEPVETNVYNPPITILDGTVFDSVPGYNLYFVARHIKIDDNNGYIYAFKDWAAKGVELKDTTSINLLFKAPNNDIIITPNYYLLGNVDKDVDETITAFDIMALANGIKNGNSEKELDINLDGTVAATDVITLSQIIKGSFDISTLYYTVNVEGKDVVKYESPVSNDWTLEVPLLAILEAYGAVVEWESDTVATITYNEDCYKLNIAEFSMYKVGDEYNYLFGGVPGSKLTHTAGIKEIYIEEANVQSLIYTITNDRKIINFDFEKRIVNVIDNPNF